MNRMRETEKNVPEKSVSEERVSEKTVSKQTVSEEHDLIRKFLRGEQWAFDRLMNMHQKKIYRVAWGMLGNHDEAADVTQEVFEEFDAELEEALAFGRDDCELARGKTEKEDEGHCDKKDHDDIVRKEMLWMLDLDSDKRKEVGNGFPEDFVEEVDYE